MKKILFALAVLASMQIADAQVKTASAAKSAVESAVEASQNPKKAAKAATWMKLGQAYLDAYNVPAGSIWQGATKQELQLVLAGQKPTSSEQVTVGGYPMTKEVYEDKNLYFNQNSQLSIIQVTKPVIEGALDKAAEAFEKAYSLDPGKEKDIKTGMETVKAKFTDEAYNAYTFNDIKSANSLFEKCVKVAASAPLKQLDTNALYNQGFTAWNLGDNAQAKDCFEKCVAANYFGEDGEVYAKLGDIAAKDSNATASRNYLEQGFAKFPQSQSILVGLINYYITSGESTEKLFTLLDQAKKNEPSNASLYYVEGNIRLQLKQKDEAIAAYNKCSEISPDYEFGYIGVGTLYYNDAIEIQTKAQEELDDTKYNALMKDFESDLKNCIEPFEKAYNVTKDDKVKVGVAEYLKNACYRFREDPKYKEAYDKYAAVVETGKPI